DVSGDISSEVAGATLASAAGAVRDHVRLSALDREDLDWFANREDLDLAPAHAGKPGIARYVNVTAELMMLLGAHVAAGSCVPGDGVRFAIGLGRDSELGRLSAQLAAVFGLPVQACEALTQLGEVKLHHQVAALVWQKLVGAGAATMPDRMPE